MKIYEAAAAVLKESTTPLPADQILAEIKRRDLFQFKAKDEKAILVSAIRRRQAGSKACKGPAMFQKVGTNYALTS